MRRMLAIACTAAAVLLAGCDSDDSTGPAQNAVSGTWNLTTVNGAALPFITQSTPRIELVSEQLVVSANGTFTQASQVRTTSGTTVSNQTISSAGTYTLSGATAAFIFNDGTTGAGTVSDNSLTVAKPGRSYVYAKQ
jgi:major membrane immunogen (membrane-anchored lipoprotein)